jgi:tetratricopeptide (TPR) repeat protein
MEPTESDIALIEKYFDSELSAEEMNHFHSRVAHDEYFKGWVEREKIIIGAIRSQGLTDNLQYLKSVEEKIQGNQSHLAPGGITRWYYYAAAIIVILVTVRLLLPSEPKTDELFAAYFTPYPNIFDATVRSSTATSDKTTAFRAYEQQDYQQAAAHFKQLLKDRKEPGVLLLLGNSNLMLGNTAEAEENFVTLIRDFDELDLPAKWYLSLCYLKSGDDENARKLLKELGETEISYASKARELLEKVD